MQNPVEGLLEVYEDLVEVLPVLGLFLTEDPWVEDLLRGAPSRSEACLFFSNDLFSLRLQSVQYDLQHYFAWVANNVDRLVVLALLQVAFFGKCDDQGLGPQDCHSPVCQILLQIVARAVITSSPAAWTSSAGILLTPADFSLLSDCTAASTSLRGMG